MKIVGIVNNYKEALEIEDIVKVFLIEQRIINLLSLEKINNFENVDSKIMKFPKNDAKYSETYSKKILQFKIDDNTWPVFNVRGLI